MIGVLSSVAVEALLGDDPARRLVVSDEPFAPHVIDSEILHTLRRSVRPELLSDHAATTAVAP